MNTLPTLTSRKEKEFFIREIIQKLTISQAEKDIYILCIEVLDESGFSSFFDKILSQFNKEERVLYTSIEPFTTTLI